MNMKLTPNRSQRLKEGDKQGQRRQLLALEDRRSHHQPPPSFPDNRDEMEWLVFSPETINYEQIQLDSGNKAH